jgi:DNA integrity scanning protein DisA with diadenylate cyclase activity
MNERILELAEQARNYALDEKRIYERMNNTEQCMEEYREVYNKKFAELIVQRTLAIVEAHTEIFQSDQARAMVEHIKHSVKSDFGVEE